MVSVVVFVKESVLDDDVYLWQDVCRGVFYDVYFRVFRIYTCIGVYSLNYQSRFSATILSASVSAAKKN
jgi:hypothetical protein